MSLRRATSPGMSDALVTTASALVKPEAEWEALARRVRSAAPEGRRGPGNHPDQVVMPDHHPRVLA